MRRLDRIRKRWESYGVTALGYDIDLHEDIAYLIARVEKLQKILKDSGIEFDED